MAHSACLQMLGPDGSKLGCGQSNPWEPGICLTFGSPSRVGPEAARVNRAAHPEYVPGSLRYRSARLRGRLIITPTRSRPTSYDPKRRQAPAEEFGALRRITNYFSEVLFLFAVLVRFDLVDIPARTSRCLTCRIYDMKAGRVHYSQHSSLRLER